MRKTLIFFTFSVVLMISGCSQTQQQSKISSTIFPETIFEKSPDEVRAAISSEFMSFGAILEQSTNNTLVFRVPDPNSSMRKMFFACSWCSDPYFSITFAILPLANGTKVVSQYWYEIPQANGSSTRMDSDSNEDFNNLQRFLWRLSNNEN